MAPLVAPAPTPPPPPRPEDQPPWSNSVHWLGTVLTPALQRDVLARLRSQGLISKSQKEWV